MSAEFAIGHEVSSNLLGTTIGMFGLSPRRDAEAATDSGEVTA